MKKIIFPIVFIFLVSSVFALDIYSSYSWKPNTIQEIKIETNTKNSIIELRIKDFQENIIKEFNEIEEIKEGVYYKEYKVPSNIKHDKIILEVSLKKEKNSYKTKQIIKIKKLNFLDKLFLFFKTHTPF